MKNSEFLAVEMVVFRLWDTLRKNVLVLKRASTKVSLGTNTAGSCGRVQGVQIWTQHSKKNENKTPSGLFFREKKIGTLPNLPTLRQRQGE